MRGTVDDPGQLFSYISLEQRVAARHPLRTRVTHLGSGLVITHLKRCQEPFRSEPPPLPRPSL